MQDLPPPFDRERSSLSATSREMFDCKTLYLHRRFCIMAPRERDRSQRSGSVVVKTVGQLGSSRSSVHQPGQLKGPRARRVPRGNTYSAA